MGGKNKQRTKGNVRPSSSGRAAELLARESGVVPGFVGFATTTTTEPGYVPAVHGAEEIDNLVDADFRLVLRKLSKRDTVTKLKAAQEFGAMCQERDSEVVKGVLPYWPRIYCKISMDHDRRVREATQQAFEQLVLKVRRSLAPYLKSVMGHWLLSQCDSYPPAASAACQAFNAAFPPSKQAEALSFCKDEVLTVLQDNLLKETADTLSDPQSVPEEEREAKFIRLLTSSLLGVKRLLSSLPQTDTHNLQDRLTHLLNQAKFWKYSRHKTPQVRGAFFEVVSSLCEHTPGLMQTEAARVCPAVLLSIDDTDPVVLPPLWEAVLHTLSTLTDCWSHVNARKAVLPKLWSLLKDGGKGLATALHPNLLPLISKLPTEVTTPNLDFYTTFYSCLIQGLSSERAVSSPSESAAIVVSAVECLRYTLLQNTGEEEEHTRIRTVLLEQQLLPLIDSALGSPSLQAGPLFPLVTDMLVSWEKRAGLQDVGVLIEGENEVVFDRLLADFWEGLRVMLARRVQSDSLEQKDLEGMSSLLQVMQSPVSAGRKQTKKKRSVKICFSEPESSGSPEEEGDVALKYAQPEAPELGQETAEGPLKSWHLEEIVCQQTQISYSHVNDKNSERHLVYLSLLLRSFHTPRVFTMLLITSEEDKLKGKDEQKADGGGGGGVPPPSNPAVRFLLERVVLWLGQEDRRDTSYLVEMVFSSLRCCSPQETTRILNHITTMDLKWGVLLQIIQKACADPVSLQACGDWFKGSVLGERLLGLAEELCEVGLKGSGSAPNRDSWALISLALSQHHNNEPLIGAVYVEKMIAKLHATLSAAKGLSERGNLEPLVCFICDVASTFFTSVTHCLLLASAEELLLTVFTLTAQDQTHTHLSDSLLKKLSQVCHAGVLSLVHHSGSEVKEGSFLYSAAFWVKTQLLTSSLGVKSLQVLVLAVQRLADTLRSVGQRGSAHLSQFLSFLTPSQSEWSKIRQALPPQWVRSPLLSGRLRMVCDYPCVEVWRVRGSSRLPAHLCVCALLTRVVYDTDMTATTGTAVATAAVCPDDQEGAGDYMKDFKHTVCELLYAVQWCREMDYSPALVTEYYTMLKDWDLTERIDNQGPATDILDTLYSRSLEEGGLWSLTLQNYIHTNHVAETAGTINTLCGSPDSLFPLSESRLSTLQVLCPYLTTEERERLISLAAAGILNWQEDPSVCGCVSVLLCCLKASTPVQEEMLTAVLATMMEWRNSKEDWFLFSSDLSKTTTAQLSLSVEMMRFLSRLVTHSPTILGGSQWDFLLCSMLAWLETTSDNVGCLWNPWVQLLVCEICELIVQLNQFFTAPPPGVDDLLPSELTAEWNDFFIEGIYSLMLPLPGKITEAFKEPDDPLFPLAVLRSVGMALTYIPLQQLTHNSLPARFVADQKTSLPEALQTLLNTLTPLLLFKARPLQLTVYHILDKVMPTLPECDGEGDDTKPEDDGEEPCLSPPAALMTLLSTCEELCESIMVGVCVGEFAVVQPLSVEYSCILAYLLAWKLLLSFFKASPSHLRVQYSLYLKKSLHKLLLHLFRLMPENPAYVGQGAEPVSKETKTFFTESLSLDVNKSSGIQYELSHLACCVYYSAVQDLPAMVRLWWTSQEKRVSHTVDKFTGRYVSPVLSAQEISSVHASTQTFDSMTVKARSAAREVIATYSVDDIFIELVIQLPQNYPLGSITVESGRRVGVAVQQWRNWMLQLSTYLTHQNGSIMEGLVLWKNNVDKRFEGVEDCMICFSVIHGSNYSLPKKACRTCKKKFHSACLYKWFTSSNKSTCPLCRETFF
ncbi:E3 ubiquitin-protein ligase listerin isoform 1-T1 [Salvelinus alpinus]